MRRVRIAYVLHWNGGPESGVFKKVLSQINQWKSFGHEVRLFVLTKSACHPHWQAVSAEVQVSVYPYENLVVRIRQLNERTRDVLKWNPDIVYTRFEPYSCAMDTVRRHKPTVLEINSDDVIEYRKRGFFRRAYNQLTRGWTLASCSGMVFVTNELAQSPHYAFGVPFVVIGNGISLRDIPILSPANNAHPRLVFIGTPRQPWHGVDKLVFLAKRFPNWHFDLIGVDADDVGREIPNNVQLHGILTKEKYQPIMAQADVAIGTLALHRKLLNESSALKVREYLAYGLPVIMASKDVDFPTSAPFLLELPNTEDNIASHIEAIESFVKFWMGKRVSRNDIAHLDISVKEKKRIEFFTKIIESNRGNQI